MAIGVLSAVVGRDSGAWEGVSDGDVVRITSAANDAALVDLELAVTGLHVQTNATARRLPCRLVTRDA